MTIVPKKKANQKIKDRQQDPESRQAKTVKEEHNDEPHLKHNHSHNQVVDHHNSNQCSTSNAASVDYSGYNSGDEHTHDRRPFDMQWTDEEYEEREKQFEKRINKKGWVIKKMDEDGACLFRAVADQIYGDQDMHSVLRKLCVDYIAKNSDYFSQYVTEDFGEYLKRKSLNHSHGNHIEIQAMSEMFNRPIEVYHYSNEPINIFQGLKNDSQPIRLSYHRSVHYNSIVDPFKATVGVGLGLPAYNPGVADKSLLEKAIRMSDEDAIEKAMLEDKLLATDWEATNEAIEEQVARESYLEWLRENENRSYKRFKKSSSPPPTTTAASCSLSKTPPPSSSTSYQNQNNFNNVDYSCAGSSGSCYGKRDCRPQTNGISSNHNDRNQKSQSTIRSPRASSSRDTT